MNVNHPIFHLQYCPNLKDLTLMVNLTHDSNYLENRLKFLLGGSLI